MEGRQASKREMLEQLLEQGMVLVALDPRVEGVSIPSHLNRESQLRLNLSYRFGLPMTIDDWGVDATLTFAGQHSSCKIPWSSVFLMVSHATGQPYLFPDSVPAELVHQATDALHNRNARERETRVEIIHEPKTPKPARPQLSLVRPADPQEKPDENPAPVRPASPPDQPDPPPQSPPRRGHLRLVK